MELPEILRKHIQETIDEATQKIFETMCCNESAQITSTSSIYTETNLTKEKLNEIIEQLRPEYAILINNYVPDNEIFEMKNLILDRYYCKKLLLMNKLYYQNKLKNILKQYGINIRIYE